MNIYALLNFNDFSSKFAVIYGITSVVNGVSDLWKLRGSSIPNPQESTPSIAKTPGTEIKSNILPVIGKIAKNTVYLFSGLAFGASIYTVAKHSDDPCVLPKFMLSGVFAELLKSHKTAEKICHLCPSMILQKISPQTEENILDSQTIDRENLEKNSIEVIHKFLKSTAAISQIAYGLYSICSNIQPLREAWNGISPHARAQNRLENRYGKEILNFENNSKEKILILREHDTIQHDGDSNFINAFKADHDLKVKVLSPGESSYKEICDALQTGNLKAVYHTVHGNPYRIGTKNPTSDELNCLSKYLPKQNQKPTYILQSCEAGHLATIKKGPAIEIAKNTGMKVFANTKVGSSLNILITNTNPVEVTFSEYGKLHIESTVTIEPRKTGYFDKKTEYFVELPRNGDISKVKRTFDYIISLLRT